MIWRIINLPLYLILTCKRRLLGRAVNRAERNLARAAREGEDLDIQKAKRELETVLYAWGDLMDREEKLWP